MAADPVFIDTNVLVAAPARTEPRRGFRPPARLEPDAAPACISGQVCRELLVALTRQPVAGRVFTSDEELGACTCRVRSVRGERGRSHLAPRAPRRHGVKRKQVNDANIVATMRAAGLKRLATFNLADFARFEHEIAVEALVW
jgi:predicted nucleic acid-binding protein